MFDRGQPGRDRTLRPRVARSERLVPERNVPRPRPTEAGDLLERTSLGERRTLIGSHRCTSLRRRSFSYFCSEAPSRAPAAVYPPLRRSNRVGPVGNDHLLRRGLNRLHARLPGPSARCWLIRANAAGESAAWPGCGMLGVPRRQHCVTGSAVKMRATRSPNHGWPQVGGDHRANGKFARTGLPRLKKRSPASCVRPPAPEPIPPELG
jgi:hypothetical protein